jgi:O-antigen ligase
MSDSATHPNAIHRRTGVAGRIDQFIATAIAIPWWFYLVGAYGFLIPVVAMNLPGVGGLGAADLLMPIGGLVIFSFRRTGKIQTAHVALALFSFAALISLTQIDVFRPLVDCTIRWVRLFGILIPFYFCLFIPVNDKVLKCALSAWMIGGLTAIAIGIVIHILQIEVRAGQQRLWMNGCSMLRAGGLIGNSGAFGHMTSTWAVITATYFLSVSKLKIRYLIAGGAVMMFFYVIYISSSRAALMHLFAAGGVFCVLWRVPKVLNQWLVLGTVFGTLAIVFAVCLSQCLPSNGSGGGRSNAFETNMKRFIPGYGGTSTSEFTSNRADNWPEYISMMNEKALTGWGYKMGVRLHEESPDNSYLSVMLETGALGFLCMSMFVVSVFYRLFMRYYAGDPYAIIMISVCVGQLANCMTSDIYTFWITMPVVFMLLGLVTQRRCESQTAPPVAAQQIA